MCTGSWPRGEISSPTQPLLTMQDNRTFGSKFSHFLFQRYWNGRLCGPEVRRSTPASKGVGSSPLNTGNLSSSHLLHLYFPDLSLACCTRIAYQLKKIYIYRQIPKKNPIFLSSAGSLKAWMALYCFLRTELRPDSRITTLSSPSNPHDLSMLTAQICPEQRRTSSGPRSRHVVARDVWRSQNKSCSK